MLKKQLGGMHYFVLLAIVASLLIGGLMFIVMLDKSLNEKIISQRQSRNIKPVYANDNNSAQPTLGAAKDTKSIEDALTPKEVTDAPSAIQLTQPDIPTEMLGTEQAVKETQ